MQFLEADFGQIYGDENMQEVLDQLTRHVYVKEGDSPVDSVIWQFFEETMNFANPTFTYVASYVHKRYRRRLMPYLETFLGEVEAIPEPLTDFIVTSGSLVTSSVLGQQLLDALTRITSAELFGRAASSLALSMAPLFQANATAMGRLVQCLQDPELPWPSVVDFVVALLAVVRNWEQPEGIIAQLYHIMDQELLQTFPRKPDSAGDVAIVEDRILPLFKSFGERCRYPELFAEFVSAFFAQLFPILFEFFAVREPHAIAGTAVTLVTVSLPFVDWPWEELVTRGTEAITGWTERTVPFIWSQAIELWLTVGEKYHNLPDVAQTLVETIEASVGSCDEIRTAADALIGWRQHLKNASLYEPMRALIARLFRQE
jgi:hypothetical protein